MIYSMIINNTYDYDNEGTTTDDIEVVYDWLRAGCEQVAILDGCSLAYLGYMDYGDLYKQGYELVFI